MEPNRDQQTPNIKVIFSWAVVILWMTASLTQASSFSVLQLHLVWHNGDTKFPLDFGLMAKGVQSLFSDMGIAVTWSQDPSSLPVQTNVRVIKVIMMPIQPSRWHLPENTMGAAPTKDGVTDSVFIFSRNVLRGLGLDPTMYRLPSLPEKQSIARALGRVVAHEVIHVLAPQCEHASHGLMRQSLDDDLLQDQRILVEPDMISSIYAGLASFVSSSSQTAKSHPSYEPGIER